MTTMTAATADTHPVTNWFPLFEFQAFTYQSFLLLPTREEDAAEPGTAVRARKWARGDFVCGQAFTSTEGFTLGGTLIFSTGVELSVAAHGKLGVGDQATFFEATGTGMSGPLKGMVSRLVGWVFPDVPVVNGGGRVQSVRGATWAVRGTDANPGVDPSGMPLGTVGAFVIARVE